MEYLEFYAASEPDTVYVTWELMVAGKSRYGAWSAAQLELLGVAWPPRKGWLSKLINNGATVRRENARKFVALKDKHL